MAILTLPVIIGGCQSNEDIAVEACSAFISQELKAPSTFKLVEKSAIYTPAISLNNGKYSDKDKYFYLNISYDAENSFGVPLRGEQRCDFFLKNGEMERVTSLHLYAAQNEAKNALVCYEKTVASKSRNEPLICTASVELKKECCLPPEHYENATGKLIWK